MANEFAQEILRASSALDDLDTFAVDEARSEKWTGDAAQAYSGHVRRSSQDAATASLALRAGAKAVWAYADELERLQHQHESLADWQFQISHALTTLRNGIAHASEDAHSYLKESADDLRLTISNYSSDLRTYKADLASNTADLVAALRELSSLPQARIATSGGDMADSLFTRPGAPGPGSTPADVAAWWAGLNESQRIAVIAARPEIIGSADGLPASARDTANRILLENDIDELDYAEAHGGLSESQRTTQANIRSVYDALAQRTDPEDPLAIDPITHQPIPSFLLLYQPTAFGGDGAIAIAIGDPDTADNVAVTVPGIRTTMQNSEHYAKEASHLYESARLADQHSTTASIMWIGYDAPSGLGVGEAASEANAIDGGDRLSQYVSGLQASREGNSPHMTVIGHSYGSTTAAHAASDAGLETDDLVLVGSPGAGRSIDHASQLNVAQVWAGNNSRDIVAQIADDGSFGLHNFGQGLGNDTGEDTFGALRFQAEADNRMTGWNPTDDGDHLKYFDRGTESCINMGEIIVGDYEDVIPARQVHDNYGISYDHEWDRTPTPTLDLDTMRENPDA